MTAIAEQGWDAIVIGSGIGGLAAAAALARLGKRVLVLEKHYVVGGLTHTFSRQGYSWDVGVHYVGAMSPESTTGRVLSQLTDTPPSFAAMPNPYDRLLFPGGFEFPVRYPEEAYFADLAARFPDQAEGLQGYRRALKEAVRLVPVLFGSRSMPAALGAILHWLKRSAIRRWAERTTAEVVAEYVRDPHLAGVLTAQWGDYGGTPQTSSFLMHALVITSYWQGAYYPVGGASGIAAAFVSAIEKNGGRVRTQAGVGAIQIEDGRAVGVALEDGERIDAPWVISDIGARETIIGLIPAAYRDHSWAREILSLAPNIAHLGLYLGWRLREGDTPETLGVGAHNEWCYADWDVSAAVWKDPFEQAGPPLLFVSFPSLKDPGHDSVRHTAEAIAWTSWELFAPWAESIQGARDPEYQAFKDSLQRAMFDRFAQRYPRIAERVEYAELSTPLSTVTFTGHSDGAFYGLEASPRRMLSTALSPKTPIPRLLLAGQDVCTPGVQGALIGGVLAAGCVDARILRWLR